MYFFLVYPETLVYNIYKTMLHENNEHNYGTYQKLRNITVKIKYEIPVVCKMQGKALCENDSSGRFTISFVHKIGIEHYLVI